MTPVLNKNKFYLLLVYLSLTALGFYFLPAFQGEFTLLFVVTAWAGILALLYDPLLNAIQDARGYIAPNDEFSFFSAFIDLNKKIHKLLQIDDVLILVKDTLSDKVRVKNMVYLVSPHFMSPDDTMDHKGFNQQAGEKPLKVWPDNNKSYKFLNKKFESELLALHGVSTSADASPTLREAMLETATSLVIPIIHNGRILCVIMVGYLDEKKTYTEFEIQMYSYLANQLSIIMDRIRIYEQIMKKTAMDHAEKMQVMQSLSANIAHEMRTPLSGIRASITGIETYLPDLIEAYERASSQEPVKFPPLRENHRVTLKQTPARITLMIDQASAVIDMLLMNLRDNSLDRRQLSACQAAECLHQAIDRYPFKTGEREKIQLEVEEDFSFLGIESLFIYVIFNLLKNALYSIKSAEKGEISISLRQGEKVNRLHFLDTGEGIEQHVLDRIFEGFFTTKADGTGAGLAFCRRTIESFDGEIQCASELGRFTEFTIEFPPLKRMQDERQRHSRLNSGRE